MPPLEVLILDFRLVEGLDYATVTSFRRLKQMIEEAGAQLALAGLCIASLGPLLAIAALLAVILRMW